MTTKIADAKPANPCPKHKAFERGNCPSCGTAADISTKPATAPRAAKKAAPAKTTAKPAKAAETPVPDRLSADGKTVLEIGMQVVSTKDGKAGEVVGLDRSPRYVRVRFTDGVTRVRSTATLKVAGRKVAKKA